MQPVIEETAAKLAATDPALMNAFLTNYSVSTGDAVFRRWQELAEAILTKHVDGYVKDAKGRPKAPGYSKEWLQRGRQDHGPTSSSSPIASSRSRPTTEGADGRSPHEPGTSPIVNRPRGATGTMVRPGRPRSAGA